MVAGTMVSLDLDRARRLYQDFLGFDCVNYAPGRLLLRDDASKRAMQSGSPNFFVIDVKQVDEITHPQHVMNHWGITVDSQSEVDRLHAEATRLSEEFGLKVRKITNIHDAYGFYFADGDSNWWEIECRNGNKTNQMIFDAGDQDFGRPGAAQ